MNFIIVKPAISQQEFLQALVAQFPTLAEEVLDEFCDGLIHLQVFCLAKYANELISNGRLDMLTQVFDFFQATVDKVDNDTGNALYVSFLENIEMDGNTVKVQEARKLVQPEYLKIWRELRGPID